MRLDEKGLENTGVWEKAGIRLPGFPWEEMCAETRRAPVWIHFGGGNIFRGFIAGLQQDLLNKGEAKAGITAVETFDYDLVEKIYRPFQNRALMVTLFPDGKMAPEVVASVAESLRTGADYPQERERLREIFRSSSLQLASYTITEKGYRLIGLNGGFTPEILDDFQRGPENCTHAMSLTAALLWERFQGGETPIALVSMDNCSRNGEKLRAGVLTVAEKWLENGFVSREFLNWIQDERVVSFPWTMIDKITPRPAEAVERELAARGIEGMAPIVTEKGTYIAPFVNGERPQYLVVEDRFPNGRPPLERAGVYMTDRETVNQTEKMKVATCLNPLHTALAVFGCLLGYRSIAAEMKDPQLRALVERIGYVEGLPVAADPGIMSPEAFLQEVTGQRLPNPFIPDTPQRIATDTSQKMAVRFGETIKSYMERPELDPAGLVGIPLVIAGWLRYLLGTDDEGQPMDCSPDPMLESLRAQLGRLTPDSAPDQVLEPLLSNSQLFGADLREARLMGKIGGMLREMLVGPGAVRRTLEKYL
ncbi:mannitol dehydrogenase family protein [Acutalibacter sp. 1XD8-33]|uniref:mannitol dehydrogenase family protein n=1 Tax=Acutalibacter sp. 1XD8-33 TaxID=2320081 RepID=UPI000EA0C619|nr:mannitol dehydrogenase family protein [Acutalibacter sp. 1XD8-33]RKJ40809.1 mannitol dehydrogenase family protein [Acutalibacter sp. 1XD8-33]